MNILQFLRILWAYRMIVLATTAVAFAGGLLATLLIKPTYEAQSRIMLDVIKPDPVTGQVIATNFLKAYTKTQIELIKDQQVARKVVSDLKWASNPEVQRLYNDRDGGSGQDFVRWAEQTIMDGAEAELIEGSNILEIKYTSPSAVRAREVAEGLRKAYVDLTLESRRETAGRNAEWYETQAEKSRELLMKAEGAKSAYERESGIILQDNQTDIDTARLAAMAQQGPAPIFNAAPPTATPATMQIAQVDAQISQLSKVLGPNHPQLLDLRRQREVLTNQEAMELRAASAQNSAAAAAARVNAGLLEQQKAKVMAQREQVERLRIMQSEVDLRRQQYNNAVGRAAQLRQEEQVAVSGVTTLGAVVMPQAPVSPNKPLILGASFAGGMGFGLGISLLMELIGRRVRGAEDVLKALDAPVLAVVRSPKAKRKWSASLAGFLPTRSGRRVKMAGA